ncbi:MAG TPA: NAD(P)-binding protein [Candidatus Hydrogenedentes bacterium]|nr:NAD(P)-binding protein [Candidatus Hydrogenedentota bacterium]HPC15245.1 NAD(P)-binding protein [Candidatus Hydrogenedentota bacterium]HRT19500.1 NAD(P)-binding protein [Candidatus Hydrogenedentota bacterium]HRT64244.1 NAD(P)-binding protein [Candidatus Hydrogenedentota bacterium]
MDGNSIPTGAVLVCGAGVAGIQASLDLSAAGFHVYLVEDKAAVGGGMARLDKTFPTGDCATCIISPKLVECMRDPNIEVLTMADVVKLDGEPGHFKATVLQRPRYVDIDKCTMCGDCSAVCPIEVPSAFDAQLGTRKAIDRVYAQAAPNAFVIQKRGRAVCSSGCPIDSSVQAYVALIAAGRFQEAADVIRRENPLPSICGRVCFHPCELKCNRGAVDEPVNIRGLKRFAMDQFPSMTPPADIPATGKSVAIIGSGPAGLSAAHFLALAGHQVTVFEALPVLGGMLSVGIPDYRLPPDILERDLAGIRSLGVEFKTRTAAGRDVSADSITNDFDAVFIATGAHESQKLDIPGENAKGVMHGADFLRQYALGEKPPIGKRVVVVGGGNTAIDAARTAVRLGAQKVMILYRRTRDEMPADPLEIDAAIAEGVEIQYLAAPIRAVAENGTLTMLRCKRMQLGEPDESGRRRPVPIEGSEFEIQLDTLIPAVSQSVDRKLAELFGLDVSRWGTIVTDEVTMAASRKGFFAGGDVVMGPSSVIDAIAHGKRAAKGIDNYLSGRPLDTGIARPSERPNPLCPDDLKKLKKKIEEADRVAPAERDVSERIRDFREVEHTYTAEEAQREARRCLNCGVCCECLRCVEACKAGAIMHEQTARTIELEVGAVVLAPGFEAFDGGRRGEFGFGHAQNVVTNVQFERILSASGPTQGHVVRPSDGKTPKRLAFIQCVGSRDTGCDNEYCSSVCCMAATKEAILAKEHEPDLDITIFFLDLRAFGKDFDRYYERARNMGIRYVRSFISRTFEMPDTKNLALAYFGPDRRQVEEEFDMVVLSVGFEPSEALLNQAGAMGIALNKWGFAETSELSPVDTSRPGVFVGGAFQEPKDIPDTVMQASAAAARAMALLSPARGTQVRVKQYPPQRDVTDEPPRIGVFVCHCGSNIASVVDVERVVERIKTLPHVVYAEHTVYTCADDSQARIKQHIAEHRLNRVVVASCTPRTHEPIFRDTLRDAGLNPYLLEMANIREQCSWVHAGDHEAATQKAIEIVRMIVARAAELVPLKDETAPVEKAALIVGGGIAGMTAALAIASQGFSVHLVEKSDTLGGTARRIYRTLDGSDVQAFLDTTIEKVNADNRITVHLNAKASKVEGHIGAFSSTIASNGQSRVVKHGVVVVATGATELRPHSYGYGTNDKVLTQLELSERLGRDEIRLPDRGTVVMIQCVEQRNGDHPYCSRVCCATAVKNALILRARYPQARIVVLYRDMRTYGFREAAYREARKQGVLFIRYDVEQPPELDAAGLLRVNEPSLGRTLELKPDMIVLAAPMIPRADREELSELLRVPLNADGFFLEAHVKLRPVDFASEGLFLCGTAHAPKSIGETLSQANAVAARAASILSRKTMPVGGQIAWVDPDKCISCMTCVHICPYHAPMIGRNNKAEIQGVVCMGCGSCTAECPAKAIELRHYLDNQILRALDFLLVGDSTEESVDLDYLEQVGVAPPRWHKGLD